MPVTLLVILLVISSREMNQKKWSHETFVLQKSALSISPQWTMPFSKLHFLYYMILQLQTFYSSNVNVFCDLNFTLTWGIIYYVSFWQWSHITEEAFICSQYDDGMPILCIVLFQCWDFLLSNWLFFYDLTYISRDF